MDSIASLSVSTQKINIPRTVIDPHFRYTMPPMKVQVVGRGKMIKTILLNLPDVAADLFRPPDYVLHFFGFDLGASFEIDNKEQNHPKYIIKGQRSLNELNDSLDKFIDGFLLCGKCKNPETVISVKRNTVVYRCKACGQTTTPNPGHKLTNYILKHPIKEESKEDKQKAKEKQQQAEESEEEWAVDTSDAAIAERASKLAGGTVKNLFQTGKEEHKESEEPSEHVTTATTTSTTATTITTTTTSTSTAVSTTKDSPREAVALTLPPGGNPMPLLKKYWNSKPPIDSVEEQISQFQSQQKYADKEIFNLVFGSLFDAGIEKDFIVKADYMKLFVKNHKDQKQLLICLEKLCQLYPKEILPKLSSILQHYYNCEMLDDDIIFDWYDNTTSVGSGESSKRKKLAQEIAEKSKEFINWLESDV